MHDRIDAAHHVDRRLHVAVLLALERHLPAYDDRHEEAEVIPHRAADARLNAMQPHVAPGVEADVVRAVPQRSAPLPAARRRHERDEPRLRVPRLHTHGARRHRGLLDRIRTEARPADERAIDVDRRRTAADRELRLVGRLEHARLQREHVPRVGHGEVVER